MSVGCPFSVFFFPSQVRVIVCLFLFLFLIATVFPWDLATDYLCELLNTAYYCFKAATLKVGLFHILLSLLSTAAEELRSLLGVLLLQKDNP